MWETRRTSVSPKSSRVHVFNEEYRTTPPFAYLPLSSPVPTCPPSAELCPSDRLSPPPLLVKPHHAAWRLIKPDSLTFHPPWYGGTSLFSWGACKLLDLIRGFLVSRTVTPVLLNLLLMSSFVSVQRSSLGLIYFVESAVLSVFLPSRTAIHPVFTCRFLESCVSHFNLVM